MNLCPLGHPVVSLPRAGEPPGLTHDGKRMELCKTCDKLVIDGKFPAEKVEQKPEPRRTRKTKGKR